MIAIDGELIHFRAWKIPSTEAKRIQTQDAPYPGLCEWAFDVEDEPSVELFGPAIKGARMVVDSISLPLRKLKKLSSAKISIPNGQYVVTLLHEEGRYGEIDGASNPTPADWSYEETSLSALTGNRSDAIASRLFLKGEASPVDQYNLLTRTRTTEFGLLKVGGLSKKWLLPLREVTENKNEFASLEDFFS